MQTVMYGFDSELYGKSTLWVISLVMVILSMH